MKLELFFVVYTSLLILPSYGELVEDMEMDPEQLSLMGITEVSRRWTPRPWGTTIEYLIDGPLEVGRPNITVALKEIEEVVTCLTFKEIPNTSNLHKREYIFFKTGESGCHSQVGRRHEIYTKVHLDLTVTPDRKSTRLNSSHSQQSRMPSSA